MSLKDLFDKVTVEKSLARKSAKDIGDDVESVDYVEADIIDEKRFIPDVDFSRPENFARYGSATRYYNDAIVNIYKSYPYDGSLYEKVNWENSASYVDLYIFKERYPRRTGYIRTSVSGWGTLDASSSAGYGRPADTDYEYISLFGGPHTSSTFPQTNDSNVWDPSNNRASNLALNLVSGSTVEFWMKKEAFNTSDTSREVVFDLWNNEDPDDSKYGRLRVELDAHDDGGSPFLVTVLSGATNDAHMFVSGTQTASLGSSLTVADNAWHHYAITFKSASIGVATKLYVDGFLNQEKVFDASGSAAVGNDDAPALRGVGAISGSMSAYIGALRTTTSGSGAGAQYAGKLSASLDEFRYWKTERSGEDIGRYWFTQVGGGTNTDLANTDLGVYYKFNEGITQTASYDRTVLDYSGRVTNGTWIGYSAPTTVQGGPFGNMAARSTGSAIVSASAAQQEFRDPIVYSFHPEVRGLQGTLQNSASYYDYNNVSSFFNMFPSWMQEADAKEGNNNLAELSQIASSYFDTVQLQIEHLNTIKDIEYVSGSNKANVFSERLLAAHGLLAPELFLDADILEQLADRSEKTLFANSLSDIKNRIYQNVYNNLIHIYKSKGTAKSFRNLIRCFGIDEELIKLNLYGNNVEYELRNNFTTTEARKRLIDFNHVDRNNASVFQSSSLPGDLGDHSYASWISGSTALASGSAFTLEAEIVFPKKPFAGEASGSSYAIHTLSSSLFGLHNVSTGSERAGGNLPTWDSTDPGNFQVYAIRDELDSTNAYFQLTCSAGGYIPNITSSVYNEVYDNTRWSFAVRVKPNKYPWVNEISGTAVPPGEPGSSETSDYALDENYVVELYGVQMEADVILNEFTVSSSVFMEVGGTDPVSPGFITGSKRVYVGAHTTNFTGSVLAPSDVKVSACRYWLDYVDSEAIKAHARDVRNYGARNPYRSAYLFQNNLPSDVQIRQIDTLALNWDFEQVTGSNADGNFVVADFSSGSTWWKWSGTNEAIDGTAPASSSYGWLGPIMDTKHPGIGWNFPASSIKVVDVDYLVTSRQNLPENLYADDMITAVNIQDDLEFTRASRPTNFYFAFEKSMYRAISEEMLNMFATIAEFNNIIGEPVNKYRPNYKHMEKLRELFYQRVENTPDLDKYIEFYKWFDSSLTALLQQLIPAGADFSKDIRTMVENTVLTRDKYQHKFPTLEMKDQTIEGAINNNQNPSPGWKFAHHPVSDAVNVNTYWWHVRADRNKAPLSASGLGVNSARTMIKSVISASWARRDKVPYRFKASGSFQSTQAPTIIHGGVNYPPNTERDIVYVATAPAGPLVPGRNIPANVMITTLNEIPKSLNDLDVHDPSAKKRASFSVNTTANQNQDASTFGMMNGNIAAPFSLYSSSLSSGYNAEIASRVTGGIELTNLHTDVYGPYYEVPMQGPFTEKFVGGRQHRHVEVNRYLSTKEGTNSLDSAEDRGEGFKILLGMCLEDAASSGAIGIVGPQYPDPLSPSVSPPYLYNRPKATRLRDVTAKRPVNIKNILMTTASLKQRMSGVLSHARIGNYQKNYQIVQSAGRSINDPFFRDQSFTFADSPMTMVGQGRDLAGYPRLPNSCSLLTNYSSYNLAKAPSVDGGWGINSGETWSWWMTTWYEDSGDRDLWQADPRIIEFNNIGTTANAGRIYFHANHTTTAGTWLVSRVYDQAPAQTGEGFPPQVYGGNWFHLAITYDSSSTANDPQFYVNGNLLAGVVESSTPEGTPVPYGAGYQFMFDDLYSKIGDFAYYNRVMTPHEIRILHDYGPGLDKNKGPAKEYLNNWFRFGDGFKGDDAPTTVVDVSARAQALGATWQSIDMSFNATKFEDAGGGFVSGTVGEYTLPQRTGSNSNNSIFVNLFSAPGGYDTLSRGFLDPAHEEKSVYNALPYRNLNVRGGPRIGFGRSGSMRATDQIGENRAQQKLLSLHCGQFGADAEYGQAWSGSVGFHGYYAPTYFSVYQHPWGGLGPFGNTYVTLPSYHKVNRNSAARLQISGSGVAEWYRSGGKRIITGSSYDNAYVTRMIPRSDKQYAWITASWVASGSCGAVGGKTGGFLSPFSDYERNLFGYLPRNGIANVYAADGVTITQKDWIPEGYPLLTASDVGCYFNVGGNPPHVTWGLVFSSYIGTDISVWLDGAAGNGKFAPMDFVTNTMLYDPIMTGSLNKLGYPEPPESDAVCITEYLNSGSDGDPHGYISVSYGRYGGASCDSGMKAGHWAAGSYHKTAGKAGVFNGLILRRNAGAWGWPVFNQIRNCGARQHPLVTFQRQNNYLTLRNAQKNPGTDQGSTQMGDTITSYIEPVVSNEHNVMTHTITSVNKVPTGDGDLRSENQTLNFKHSFGNKVDYFGNLELNNRLNLKLDTDRSDLYFNRFNSLLLKEYADPNHTPFDELKSVYMNYRQRVYPAGQNAFLNRSRTREKYYIKDIWRDPFVGDLVGNLTYNEYSTSPGYKNNQSVGGRYLFEGVPYAFSSSAAIGNSTVGMPYTISGSSVWPLDPHNYFGPNSAASNPGMPAVPWYIIGITTGTYITRRYNDSQSGSGELQNALNYIQLEGSIHQNLAYGMQPMTASMVYGLRVPTSRWPYPNQGGLNDGPPPPTDSIIAVTGDAVWQVTGSSKTPYQSYESSSLNTRHVGKDYSIVPEFRISEHMNRYVNDHGGDFWVDNNAFLDLSGATVNNSSEENFFQYYTNSDFLKLFGVVDEAYGEKQLVDDKIIKKDKLALRCSAILNFLPYKGFYPAERTIELGRLYSASYAPSVNYFTGNASGPAIQSAFRAATNPLFGPGILYNTIKSGLAVSNYTYCHTSSRPDLELDFWGVPQVSCSAQDVGTMAAHMAEWGGSQEFANKSLSIVWPMTGSAQRGEPGQDNKSFEFYPLLPLSSSTQASGSGGYFLHQIPFEALLKPAAHLASGTIPQGKMYDSGLISSSIYQYQRVSGRYSNVWPLTASNQSRANQQWAGPWAMWDGAGSKLYEYAIDNFVCETVNFFQPDLKHFISKREDEFEAAVKNKYYSLRLKLYRPVLKSEGSNQQTRYADLTKFDMYSRPSAFGNPGAGRMFGITDLVGARSAVDTYGHVTPPYYYGESSVTVLFKAPFNGKPTLDDIFSRAEYIYDRAIEGDPTSGSLGQTVSSNHLGYNIKDSLMMITSSINITDKVIDVPPGTDSNKERWLIQTKFETPVLNFAGIDINDIESPPSASDLGAGYISLQPAGQGPGYLISRGMWHQYGKLPQEDAGIFMTLDSPSDVVSPTDGVVTAESLASIVGLETGKPERIGDLKAQKTIYEAVVAVPFTLGRDGRAKFYKLKKRQTNAAIRLSNGQQTQTRVPKEIQDIVKAQKKYVFPPKFDFVTNQAIDAVVMYVFEFAKTLTQQDLADIWQNIPPGYTGEDMQTQTVTVQHSLLTDDFYDSEQRKIDSNLRWMVFKVKQRAASNYNKFVKRNLTDDLSAVPNSINTPYTYNWPYDYFSLVELIKMDAGIQYASFGGDGEREQGEEQRDQKEEDELAEESQEESAQENPSTRSGRKG